MNVDPDFRNTYDVWSELWCVDTLDSEERRRVGIHRSHRDGGVAWEFHLIEREVGGRPTLQLRMFDDSWDAFADAPELFEALRMETPHTLTRLRALLDRLGFEDITKRGRTS